MPYFDVSVVITSEKSSGASFLDKSMKKELYGLGYRHTKPTKIYMTKPPFFYRGARLRRISIFHKYHNNVVHLISHQVTLFDH